MKMKLKDTFNLVHKISCDINGADYFRSYTKSRKRELVDARQMSMLKFRNDTNLSLSVIGSLLNRDHATVLNAIKNMSNLIETDSMYEYRYALLNKRVNGYISHLKKQKIHEKTKNKSDLQILIERIKEALRYDKYLNAKIAIRTILKDYE